MSSCTISAVSLETFFELGKQSSDIVQAVHKPGANQAQTKRKPDIIRTWFYHKASNAVALETSLKNDDIKNKMCRFA